MVEKTPAQKYSNQLTPLAKCLIFSILLVIGSVGALVYHLISRANDVGGYGGPKMASFADISKLRRIDIGKTGLVYAMCSDTYKAGQAAKPKANEFHYCKIYTPESDDLTFDLNGPSVAVDTPLGQVEGTRVTMDFADRSADVFLGIPYAAAPVGNLRFKRPVAAKPWSKPLSAKKYAPFCVHYFDERVAFRATLQSLDMSEDCLYLNVFRPVRNESDTKPKAVIVLIHGGGFASGGASIEEYDGSLLAPYGDVIAVTFNYRVGALGFLDAGIDGCPGNQGLYDQLMALKWVQNNVASFGGDPTRVTLVGQSSGAISVGLHMMSPLSRDHFTRAILQSGSPTVFNGYYDMGSRGFDKMVSALGCDDAVTAGQRNQTALKLDCMVRKPVGLFLEAQADSTYEFTPSRREGFFASDPIGLFRKSGGKRELASSQQVIIGLNKEEAGLLFHVPLAQAIPAASAMKTKVTNMEELAEYFKENRQTVFGKATANETEINAVVELISKLAMAVEPGETFLNATRQKLAEVMFACPSVWFAQKLAALEKDVHFYRFTQRSKWRQWIKAAHHDELMHAFGFPWRYPNKYAAEDIILGKRMMTTWSEFARTGNIIRQLGVEWPLFSVANQAAMDLNGHNAEVSANFYTDLCQVYNEVVNSM